ncbi:MAG: carbamoyltransferase [Vulcanimicrobiota bacterium]
MICLGVNSVYHESSACIVVDGEVVAAVEEERFCRVKHGKVARVDNPQTLPLAAIDYCLRQAGVRPQQVEHIGYSFDPARRVAPPPEEVEPESWGSSIGEDTFRRGLSEVPKLLSAIGLTGSLHWLGHHLCHAASAFYASPFEEAAVMTVDGIGENDSSSMAVGRGTDLTVLERVAYPHSLGFLWEKLSGFLGFSCYDAGKVMGLAPYGRAERFAVELASLVWPTQAGGFQVDHRRLKFRSSDFSPLEELFGLPRRGPEQPVLEAHQDLAASLQAATDRIVLHRTHELYHRTSLSCLAMAGGVALNCISNRVAFEEGPFQEFFVQPAAHDAGTALGAALYLAARTSGKRPLPLLDPYLGPQFSAAEMEEMLRAQGLVFSRPRDLTGEVARRLAQGKLVGWFQGRMELGPRALGNRSLLADPRCPAVRETLNARIKNREAFRPFAPSVLQERLGEWFEVKKPTSAAESMLVCYPVKPERRDQIPAVVHVDGSSRVQAVSARSNPLFHELLQKFEDFTGVPMLLNTSFNDREPIVCTPLDAYLAYQRMGLDALAMGPYLVEAP